MTRNWTWCATLGLMLWGTATQAELRWEFDGRVEPAGAPLKLLTGKPAFAAVGPGQGLAAGCGLTWADAPALRLRPELEILCRFRLDATTEGTQTLAMKDGEYILRVDWQKEGGSLSFFVQVDGKWESRLRGPVVRPGTWYEVRAQWTGTAMDLVVNGEAFHSRRAGRIQPADEPL